MRRKAPLPLGAQPPLPLVVQRRAVVALLFIALAFSLRTVLQFQEGAYILAKNTVSVANYSLSSIPFSKDGSDGHQKILREGETYHDMNSTPKQQESHLFPGRLDSQSDELKVESEEYKAPRQEQSGKDQLPPAPFSYPPVPFASCNQLNFTDRPKCGVGKCFLLINNEPGVGYLVSGESRRRQPHMLSTMKNGTNIALRMETKYQVKHFLLDEPKLIIPAPCVIRELRKTENFRENSGSHPFCKQFIPDKNLKDGFAIQKNAIAPNPHIIVPKKGL